MAQAGFTPISLYYSTTAAAVPTSGNLVAGELALNTLDGKLYYKNSAGTVTLLASTSGASGDVVGPASATDNALARFDLTTGKLIQNSVGILSDTGALSGLTDITASGSVTLSGGTANGVLYLNGSKVATSGTALVFDGTNLGVGVAPVIGTLSVNTNSTGATANGYFSLVTSFAAAFVGVNNTAGTVRGVSANSVGFGTADVVPLTFGTSNIEAMRISAAGDVGIGTTTTTGIGATYRNLVIVGSAGGALDLSDSSGTTRGTITTDSSGGNALFIDTRTSSPIIFRTTSGTVERMRIASGGNVAIGSTGTTGARLNVTGADSVIGATATNGTITLRDANSSGATNTVDLHIRPIAGKSGGITFTEDTVADRFSIGINNGVDALIFRSGQYNGTEIMRLTGAGSLGIGTNSPSTKLMVEDSSSLSYDSTNTLAVTPILYLYNPNSGASVAATIRLDGGIQGGNSATTISAIRIGAGSSALTFGTRNGGGNVTERVRIESGGLLRAYYGSYSETSLGGVTGSNGLQIQQSSTFNDNSAHQLSPFQDVAGVLYFRDVGLSAIPFYSNGGGGVAYGWTVLNPQTGVWTCAQGPTVNFTGFSSSPNSYSVVFNGGAGSVTITRTGGTNAYTVAVQRFGTT
jgi:hypothetical protein